MNVTTKQESKAPMSGAFASPEKWGNQLSIKKGKIMIEGQIVSFTGYTDLEPGQAEIFVAGEQVRIVKVVSDENFQCVAVADETRRDSVFDTELEELPAEEIPSEELTLVPPVRKIKPAAKKAATKKPVATTAAEMVAAAKAKAAGQVPETVAVLVSKDKPKAKAKAKTPVVEPVVEPVVPPVVETPGVETPVVPPVFVPETEKEARIITQPEVYTPDVAKVVGSDAAALQAAKNLTEKIQETFWTLGGVLSYIRRHASYKTLKVNGEHVYDGKNGFAEYCETELGMKYRRAMYYVSIYETFTPLGVKEERVLSLGWAKASELVDVVNPENVDQWLDRAEGTTREDLRAEVKRTQVAAAGGGTTPAPKATMTTVKFRLFEDQGRVVLEALELAKAAIGETDDNKALAHIMTEFMALQDGRARTLQGDLDAMTAVYGADAIRAAIGAEPVVTA